MSWQERAISSSAAWRASIADVDGAMLRCLREQVAGGFDEERFGARIGFGNLKRCAALPAPSTIGCIRCANILSQTRICSVEWLYRLDILSANYLVNE